MCSLVWEWPSSVMANNELICSTWLKQYSKTQEVLQETRLCVLFLRAVIRSGRHQTWPGVSWTNTQETLGSWGLGRFGGCTRVMTSSANWVNQVVQYWWYLAGLFPCRTIYVSASVLTSKTSRFPNSIFLRLFSHFSVCASFTFPLYSISPSHFDASSGINLACWNICSWFNIWTECLVSKKHRCTCVQTASKYLDCFLHPKAPLALNEGDDTGIYLPFNWSLDYAVMLELLIPDLGNPFEVIFFVVVVWVFWLVCIKVISLVQCNSPVGLIYRKSVAVRSVIVKCAGRWVLLKQVEKEIKLRDNISIKAQMAAFMSSSSSFSLVLFCFSMLFSLSAVKAGS